MLAGARGAGNGQSAGDRPTCGLDGLALRSRPGRALAAARSAARSSYRRDNSRIVRWETLLALAFVLWVSVELGMQSLLLPVKVVSDGPIYHLYFGVRWWKAGRLFLVATPFGENAATYFPANGDVWFTWLMVAWGGDRLARIGQAPFLLLAAIAVFRIGRMLGAGRNSALLATCWFLTSTPLLIFSYEANVDTIFVAFYMIAVAFFLLDFQEAAGTAALVLGGLAAGIALGTKPVGVVFVPPLLGLVLGAKGARTRSTRKTLAALFLVLFCLLLTSGFWFGRNLLLTGNPLYPLHLELFGTSLLSGWYGRDAMRFSVYFLPITEWRALIDILLALADPRLAPFWIAALAGAWAIGGRRSPEQDRLTWALAALAVLNVALFWICIPYRTQQRFMLQALGLAAVPLARLLDRWRGLRVAAAALLILHLLTTQTWPVAIEETKIPWDLSAFIPNAVGALAALVLTHGARTSHGPGSRGHCRHHVFARHGLLRGTYGLGGQPIKRLHWPRTEESCPACSRRSGTCRPGRSTDGGVGTRCKATFLSALPYVLPRLAGPGGPLGALRRSPGLRRNEYPLLLVRDRPAERGPLRERRCPRRLAHARLPQGRAGPKGAGLAQFATGLGPGSPELPGLAIQPQGPANPASGRDPRRFRRGATQCRRLRRIPHRTDLGRFAP